MSKTYGSSQSVRRPSGKSMRISLVAVAAILVLVGVGIARVQNLGLPVQNGQVDLKNWMKYGVVLSTADLSSKLNTTITVMEDFVTFYGHDGYVYAFLAAGLSYDFRSIYLIRGSDVYFNNLQVIGKVLDNPKGVWEDIRVRPRSVVYDAENSRYLLYYDGLGSQITFASGVLSCPVSEFPQGPWSESDQNPILVPTVGGEGLIVLKKYSAYMGVYYGGYYMVSYKLCFSDDPLAKFTVLGDIPYRGQDYGILRGLLKVDGGYLVSCEVTDRTTGQTWRIYLGFIDESFRFMTESQNAPSISPTETYEGNSVANPYLGETSSMILLYYNGHPAADFSNVVLAYTPKP